MAIQASSDLKRRVSINIDYTKCIICQQHSKTDEVCFTDKGKTSLFDAYHKRRVYIGGAFDDAVERFDVCSESDYWCNIVWHRKCHSNFTNKSSIDRLRLKNCPSTSEPISSASYSCNQRITRNSSEVRCDFHLCMFCQESQKQALFNVACLETSTNILKDAGFHYVMRIRLANVTDLVAAEGKYHLNCLQTFRRYVKQIHKEGKAQSKAFYWLINELKHAASKAQVLALSSVWDRYVQLSEEANEVIPQYFQSRKSHFKEKIELEIRNEYLFLFRPVEGSLNARETVLVPIKLGRSIITTTVSSETKPDPSLTMPELKLNDDLKQVVYAALVLRSAILAKKTARTLDISKDAATACVPDILYSFVEVLKTGLDSFQCNSDSEVLSEDRDNNWNSEVISLSQDIVYSVSKGKQWTPKHVGIAATVHQATRSKSLINLLHKAGSCISYMEVLAIDTSLAQLTLDSMNKTTGAVLPSNLVHGKFTHFSADNIDINEGTLDGKNTFHATQMAAWQRGPAEDIKFPDMNNIKYKTCLEIPSCLTTLLAVSVPSKPTPTFITPVTEAWFSLNKNELVAKCRAQSTDLAFILSREKENNPKCGWTEFNQNISKVDPHITTIGYLPIIQAPAHEYDTLFTVVNRCMHVSEQLGQKYTVLTVDQALYCRLMELKWTQIEFQEVLIPMLGGLHISMNFLKVIGQHMQGSGLEDLWLESGVMGENAISMILAGKNYNRGMRIHKITCQALWTILLPKVINLLNSESEFHCPGEVDELIKLLEDKTPEIFLKLESQLEDDSTNMFWWNYLKMVSILLRFTRAQRDGLWHLYISSFKEMLPWFMLYDHINYARWGTIYVSEMMQLPQYVKDEFERGNFVVKRSDQTFNQVSPDQSQEWMNATGKKGGGLVGITKVDTALHRWALSYNLRSHISASTKQLFDLDADYKPKTNEKMVSRKERDNNDEKKLVLLLLRSNVFQHHEVMGLQNIMTKDMASKDIEDSLLNAENLGFAQMVLFVRERLIENMNLALCRSNDSEDEPDNVISKTFFSSITKNKPLTMDSLYTTKKRSAKDNKIEIEKVDRNVLQRLMRAFEAGRKVDMRKMLQHELMPVPVSIFELNGELRQGSKALFGNMLKEKVMCISSIDIIGFGSSCLIIDGQALIIAIGKPKNAQNFGDLSEVFIKSVCAMGKDFDRIDIVMDCYIPDSIKEQTRKRRAFGKRPTRRVIESKEVPLPQKWNDFMSLSDNKDDLGRFLAEELLQHAIGIGKVIVIGGAYKNVQEVRSSSPLLDVTCLQEWHEEADTRIILHVLHCNADTVVVRASDTDVLILLIAHLHAFKETSKVWMLSGVGDKKVYIPINEICSNLSTECITSLLQFHALTGCDTTSYFFGRSKKAAYEVLLKCAHLLSDLGSDKLSAKVLRDAESFVCKLYPANNDTETTDEARYLMYGKVSNPALLPPSSDALQFHIKRAHLQASIWRNARTSRYHQLPPIDFGWTRGTDSNSLTPVTMTLPAMPKGCSELVFCNCKTGCRTNRCQCKSLQSPCTINCNCSRADVSCCNIIPN